MGGRKINDYGGLPHSSDMAMNSKTNVKHYSSAEGSGSISQYEDTTDRIQKTQMDGDKQVKRQPMKPGYRY